MWLFKGNGKRHKQRGSRRKSVHPAEGVWVTFPKADDAPEPQSALPLESRSRTSVTVSSGSSTVSDLVRALRVEQAATEREREHTVRLQRQIDRLQAELRAATELLLIAESETQRGSADTAPTPIRRVQ